MNHQAANVGPDKDLKVTVLTASCHVCWSCTPEKECVYAWNMSQVKAGVLLVHLQILLGMCKHWRIGSVSMRGAALACAHA
jgi:hypothetical protein